jgi:hypothetical protein
MQVRFFERVKLERRIRKLEKQVAPGAGYTPEQAAELELLRSNLEVWPIPEGILLAEDFPAELQWLQGEVLAASSRP